MGKKLRFLWRLLFVGALVINLLLITANGIANRLLSDIDTQKVRQMAVLITPYSHASYWDDDFRRETTDVLSVFNVGDLGLEITNDYHGKYINVENHRRKVTNQAVNATNSIYFFGSSTGFDLTVPDEFTIASYLQAFIGPSYQVVNMSVSGQIVDQHYLALTHLQLKQGDIVIYYLGANEQYVPYVLAKNRDDLSVWSACKDAVAKDIALVRLYCTWRNNRIPSGVEDTAALETSILSSAGDYLKAITAAHSYAESKHAQFYVALQPNLWSKSLNANEQLLADLTIPVGEANVFSMGLPIIQALSYHTIDLTHSLDEARQYYPIYLDCCHTAEIGNRLIAHAIYYKLFYL